MRVCLGVFFFVIITTLDAFSLQLQTWEPKYPIGRNSSYHLAFHDESERVMLYGGRTYFGWLEWLWAWDGGRWQFVSKKSHDKDTHYRAMAYDQERDELLLYGGLYWVNSADAHYVYLSDTWSWDGRGWKKVAEGEPKLNPVEMVFVESERQVFMVGRNPAAVLETWKWDGTKWELVMRGGPDNDYFSCAYDAENDRIAFYGIYNIESFPIYNETWFLDGAGWHMANENSGFSYAWADVAYDGTKQSLLLYAGSTIKEWNGAEWVERSPEVTPPYRRNARIEHDPSQKYTLLFGGRSDEVGRHDGSADTWGWDGDTWKLLGNAPQYGMGTTLIYHPVHEETWLFGGEWNEKRIWKWNGKTWREELPSAEAPPLMEAAAVYHEGKQSIYVFGGWTTQNNYPPESDRFWRLDEVGWHEVEGNAPPGRSRHAMAYDAGREKIVLFGGSAGQHHVVKTSPNAEPVDGHYGDTWEWDGEWKRVAESGPSPREHSHMAYNPQTQTVLLYGGGEYSAWGGRGKDYGDTWEWDGSRWHERESRGARDFQINGMHYDPIREKVVLITANGDLWEWSDSAWQRLNVRGTIGVDGVAYDTSRNVYVSFGPHAECNVFELPSAILDITSSLRAGMWKHY